MTRIIAACGNDCAACPRYVAHPFEKTEDQLRHTAELWEKIGYRDHVVSVDEISCQGCTPSNWCRFNIASCCADRGIKTCAECADYPCKTTEECLEVTLLFVPRCREVTTTDEYRQIERAFFEKAQNLSALRARHLDSSS